MNYKLLVFSGMVTMAIGAIGGLLVGVSQEAIRQLKQKQDQE
jgi:hypothetical protein